MCTRTGQKGKRKLDDGPKCMVEADFKESRCER
jgi:hypothetical protein